MNTTATMEWYSTRELVIALAAGIIKADPFFRAYETPPGYERVLRDFAAGFVDMEDDNGAFQAPADEVRENIRDFVHEHPICNGWNAWDGTEDGTIAVHSRYSPRPEARQFIDLDAIVQNTWCSVNEAREAFRRMDAEIMAKINPPSE